MTVAIVGSETLLGRDIREVFSEQRKGHPIRQIASSGGGVFGNLEDNELLDELNAESLQGAEAILLAGTPASARKALRLARESGIDDPIIDLTATLEDQPNARLRFALLGEQEQVNHSNLWISPHPAAMALAILFDALKMRHPIRRCVVTVFEPASERGQRGLDELQQQSAGLLGFRELPKDIYDAQLAFNLLPRYGSEAVINLEDIELTIDRHLASLIALQGQTPMPSLRLVQAPVFHGYSFSLWVEFEAATEAEEVVGTLRAAGIDTRSGDEEHPTNVAVAGESGVTAGAIEADRNNPNAVWIWMVADALRLAADNALALVKGL